MRREQELRLQLRTIENRAISRMIEGVTDLIKIQQMKEAQCSKFATKDNYWGDWLPQVRLTLTRLQKKYQELKKLICEIKVFKV